MAKKTNLMRVFEFKIPDFRLVFCSGQNSVEEIAADLRKIKHTKTADEILKDGLTGEFVTGDRLIDGLAFDLGGLGQVLWLHEAKVNRANLSLLVHESNHIVRNVARNGNFSDEREFCAYLQADIFDKIVAVCQES